MANNLGLDLSGFEKPCPERHPLLEQKEGAEE